MRYLIVSILIFIALLVSTSWLALVAAAPGDVVTLPGSAFTGISSASGKIRATSPKTTVQIVATGGATVTTNPATKTITIGATATDISGKADKAKLTNYSSNRQAEINNRVVIPRFAGLSTATQNKIDSLTAPQIAYANPTYTTVAAALNQLLYVAPGSPSVSGGGTYETGQTISSVVLNWSITLGNKALTSQSIDNSIGALSTALRTYTHSGQTITANRTYIVSITDGTTPRTGSTTVSFSRYRHWGASTIPLASFTSANILALGAPSNEFSTSHSKSVTYDCTGGRYPTFAFVSTGGLLTATTVGGLSFSDYSYRTISHTNASGSVTNYYVYQFNNIQTGAAVAVVWD